EYRTAATARAALSAAAGSRRGGSATARFPTEGRETRERSSWRWRSSEAGQQTSASSLSSQSDQRRARRTSGRDRLLEVKSSYSVVSAHVESIAVDADHLPLPGMQVIRMPAIRNQRGAVILVHVLQHRSFNYWHFARICEEGLPWNPMQAAETLD